MADQSRMPNSVRQTNHDLSHGVVTLLDLFASDAQQNALPHTDFVARAASWFERTTAPNQDVLVFVEPWVDGRDNLRSTTFTTLERFGLAFTDWILQRSTSWRERVGTMSRTSSASSVAASRARRREIGMRSMEAVFFEDELAALDRLKSRLNLASRSDALRLVMAKADFDSLTPEDAVGLKSGAA